MKRNYASVNAKYYTSSELFRIINHNLRIDKIDYLLKNNDFENVNLIYGLNENYNNTNLKDINKTKFKNMFFNSFNNMVMQRRKQNQAKNYFGENEKNDLIEMVVSLSEEQTQHYLDTGKKEIIDMAFHQFAMEVKNKYGFEPLCSSIHYDEGHIPLKNKKDKVVYDVIDNLDMQNKKEKNNYHAQITFFNYDFKESRSVLRTMKKQDWRDIQDLAANTFKAFGLDYQRGIAKEITGKEHLNNLEFKIQKMEEELEEVKKENNDLKGVNNKLYEDNKDLNGVNDKLSGIIDQKNLEIIEKSDQVNELVNLLEDTKDQLRDTIKEKEKAIKDVASVKNTLKDTLNELDNVKNDLTKTRLEKDQASKQLIEIKKKLEQSIRIEQKLRKDTRKQKEFLANYEKKFKEVQILEKDKTTNLSQKIDKIKDIYLKNASLFSAFNNKGFHNDMMQEFEDLLSVNYNNRTLKEENKDLKNENKNLKNLDVVEIERQNKKLKNIIVEKDNTIAEKAKDVIYYIQEFKKVDSENTKLKDKVYDLENKDKTKNKKFHHIGD
ncbi:MAG: hypothetical protein RBT22_02080 [Aliarcobacter sp.]|jgi:hypothetical protein|nr:hypothetical protein [Aliarcobacter sp.]